MITPMRRLLGALSVSLFVTLTSLLLSGAEARAQCPTSVVTGGLQGPIGITRSNQGSLLVAETGPPAPNTGRISIVGTDGTRRTLLAGLPSGVNAIGDPSGPHGLFLRGRTLYVAIGEGDSTLAGPLPGTEIPNPNPSSPIYSSVLAVHFSAHVEKTTAGFTLTSADQAALAGGAKLNLSNGGGDRVTVELIANFPDFTPEPLPFFAGNVRHSNPYDLVVVGDQVYVTDGGQNLIWRADIDTGAVSVLTTFPPIPNPLPFGPPVVEAVPTGITYSDGRLLVTLFRGFPFPPGTSEVRTVDPLTGAHSTFIAGLSSAIDVLAVSSKGDTDYLVLQFSSDMLAGAPGSLLRFETPTSTPAVVAGCLITPSSMTLDEKTGTLYVTELATGRVVSLHVE